MSNTQKSRSSKKSRQIAPSSDTSSRLPQPRELTTLLNLQTRNEGGGGGGHYQSGGEYLLSHQPREHHHPHQRGGMGPIPTGVLHVPRRGIFYASELMFAKDAREWDHDFGMTERVCVIRFPPEVAALLSDRLAMQLELENISVNDGAQEDNEESSRQLEAQLIGQYTQDSTSRIGDSRSSLSPSANGGELGLTITPTSKEDYRIFDVEVEQELGVSSSAILLTGVLVELPCIIETYKSLEGDLLFKSNDISQMLYVFDATTGSPFDLKKIRDEQFWEWHSGLTPGTYRIRGRKFKNFRVFEKSLVSTTEKELFDMIYQNSRREQAVLEATTEDVCEDHLEKLELGNLNEPNVVSIIGPENPILKAALEGSTPLNVIETEKCNGFGKYLLRHLVDKGEKGERQKDFSMTLSERLKFSLDPIMNVKEDEIIQDDLSDRLFGDYGFEEEEEEEDDDYPMDDLASSLGNKSSIKRKDGIPSSDSSLLSSDEDIRKKSKTSTSTAKR